MPIYDGGNGSSVGGTSGSAIGGSSNSAQLLAGEALSANALLQLAYDGKAYIAENSDAAKTANRASNVFAETTVSPQSIYEGGSNRSALLRDADGTIFVGTPQTNTGFRVQKYTSAGALVKSVQIFEGAGETLYLGYLAFLSNGNILAVCGNSGGQTLRFAILDKNLAFLKATTVIGAFYGIVNGITPLSGGGFAVTYQDYADNTKQKLVVYNNAGNVTLPLANVDTYAAGTVFSFIKQLASGNLLIAMNHSGGSYRYGIVGTDGTVVKAFAQWVAGAAGPSWQEFETTATHFLMTSYDGASKLVIGVFNNAGVQQGANIIYDAAGRGIPSQKNIKALTDGTSFYVAYQNTTSNKSALAKISTAGVAITNDLSATDNASSFDGFISNGCVVLYAAKDSGGTAPTFAAYMTDDYATQVAAPTTIGSAETDMGALSSIVPAGRFSAVLLKQVSTTAALKLHSFKWADTAIVGVAAAAAAKGALVTTQVTAGAYRINQLSGSTPISFDHSATNVLGNKGLLLSHGAVLRGM